MNPNLKQLKLEDLQRLCPGFLYLMAQEYCSLKELS